jgi:glutamine amidotransferase
MLTNIAIVNYGMGNLCSVSNALTSQGASPFIAEHPRDLVGAEGIVLPGVGAFSDGMSNLRTAGWIEPLEEEVCHKRKPFLGICLGMQLLATTGTENGACAGLGWIPGITRKISGAEAGLRLPHIGWNEVQPQHASRLFPAGDAETFYFLHGYILVPEEICRKAVTATCTYGEEFAATLEYENIIATQFHPEKSQRAGLALLRRFLEGGNGAC